MIEIAAAMLARSSARAEVAAQNIGNAATPGYKAHRAFDRLIGQEIETHGDSILTDRGKDWSHGKMIMTEDPGDLAVSGSGFLVLRRGDTLVYTRGAHFARDAEGRFVSARGGILQGANGDVVAAGEAPAIAADGTVIGRDGRPADRILLVGAADPAVLRDAGDGELIAPKDAMHDLPGGVVVQGAREASNVSDAAEMIAILSALRGAETGQRVVQLYGDLLAQAADAFGRRNA